MKNILQKMILVLPLVSFLYASDGKTLYMEANCQKCHHMDEQYDPRSEKVTSLHDLKGWVLGCANNFGIEWFPEENKQVVEYLNETYYHYTEE
jgi:hypothetical protein